MAQTSTKTTLTTCQLTCQIIWFLFSALEFTLRMPEDDKQQSKADLSAYTIELRQLRMEEKAMRKVFEECSGQLTQLQVPLLIFQSFLNHIQCLKTTQKSHLTDFIKLLAKQAKRNRGKSSVFCLKNGKTFANQNKGPFKGF